MRYEILDHTTNTTHPITDLHGYWPMNGLGFNDSKLLPLVYSCRRDVCDTGHPMVIKGISYRNQSLLVSDNSSYGSSFKNLEIVSARKIRRRYSKDRLVLALFLKPGDRVDLEWVHNPDAEEISYRVTISAIE